MFFYYKKTDKRVAMRSETQMSLNGFETLEYVPTQNELLLIEQNYDLSVEDGILILRPTDKQLQEQKALLLETAKKELLAKKEKGGITTNDVVDFLQKLT